MAEHAAVNRRVVGSSPTRGAKSSGKIRGDLSWFLYILKSEVCDKFYIGISQNPMRRLEYHNTIEKGFTSRYRPWILVHKKEYETRTETHSAEMKIKDWKSKTAIKKVLCGQIEI